MHKVKVALFFHQIFLPALSFLLAAERSVVLLRTVGITMITQI